LVGQAISSKLPLVAAIVGRSGVLVVLLAACASPEHENARLLERAREALAAGQPHLAQLLVGKSSTSSAEAQLLEARARAAQGDRGGTVLALEEAADRGLRDAGVLDEPDFALVRGDFALERLRTVLSLPDGGALPHGTGLAHSTPKTEGVRADALAALLEEADHNHTAALVVLRHGKLVVDSTFGQRIPLNSCTKSFVSLAVGLLVDDGRIPSLDTPVARWFPEWVGTPKEAITVRHLLTHTSGLATPRFGRPLYTEPSLVRYALDDALVSVPGRHTAYSNVGTSLLAAVVARAAGEPVDALLAHRVFSKLGIVDFTWRSDAMGDRHGFADLSLWADDFAKVGQLMLQHGEWNGEQLISREWLAQSTAQLGESNLAMLWFVTREHELVPGPLVEQAARATATSSIVRKLEPFFQTGLDLNEVDLVELLKPWESALLTRQFKRLPPQRRAEPGKIIVVHSEGSQGQYLMMVPDDDLVVVRLVDLSDRELDERVTGFNDLRQRALTLVGTYHLKKLGGQRPETE
jgi:CubicO group peptidase (beta-lactamase class C family)